MSPRSRVFACLLALGIAFPLISGCSPMAIMCFDDPDCPRHYYYCPIEKKKVHVSNYNVGSECDGISWSCPELLMPRQCQWCKTTYKDDQGHTWSTKPYKEVVYGNRS